MHAKEALQVHKTHHHDLNYASAWTCAVANLFCTAIGVGQERVDSIDWRCRDILYPWAVRWALTRVESKSIAGE